LRTFLFGLRMFAPAVFCPGVRRVSDASGTKKYQLDEDVLEASWDYDFTNVKDGGIVWACDVDGKELAFDSKDSAALESQHTNGGGAGGGKCAQRPKIRGPLSHGTSKQGDQGGAHSAAVDDEPYV
jgi:hypothetical protein